MGFDNTDKGFTIKISSLFIVLALGVMFNKVQPTLKNTNQDIIKLENKKPTLIQTISIKKVGTQEMYKNSIR